jgi:predicted permease
MSDFLRKLARLRRRDELSDRIREEMEFHTAMSGGGVGRVSQIQEQAHDVWTFGALEHLWMDCRHAARSLAKTPGFFALAAIGTALGVAAITAVLSVADRTLIRPLPYPSADRLVIVYDQLLRLNLTRFPTSVANLYDYRAQTAIFEDVAGFRTRAFAVSTGDRVERVVGMIASPNLMAVLGVPLAQGRWWTYDERRADVAVVGPRFAGLSQIRIDGRLCRVIGVVPAGFAFRTTGDAPEIWIPSAMEVGSRDAVSLNIVGRLQRGVAPGTAAAAMHTLAANLKRQYRAGMGPNGEDGGFDLMVVPLREELFGSSRTTIYALAAGSAILLLLAAANTALLWLGRAAARRREAATRLALGAPRRRVAQQMIAEALLPSLAGGILALALSAAALRAVSTASVAELAALDRLTIDYRAFALGMVLSAAAGVLFGIVPLRSLFRGGAEAAALAHSRGEAGSRGEGRLGRVLIAVQVALACALLAPSLLLARSLAALERVDPGFRTDGLLTAQVTLPPQTDPPRYAERLEAALVAWRGRGNTAVTSDMPLSFGEGGDPFSIEGRAYGSSGTMQQFAHSLRVTQDFFSLLRMRIVAGRALQPGDFAKDAPRVAVVNETMARGFWGAASPIGHRILLGAPRPNAPWLTIVGISADIHTGSLSAAPVPQIYRPLPLGPSRSLSLIVSQPATATEIGRVLRQVDPGIPGYAVQGMDEKVAASMQRPRFRTALFSAYGVLAFLLAAFGIYSLSTYAATRRMREFAVRSALGAPAGRSFRTLMGGTLAPALSGVVAGLAGAYAIARAMTTLLFSTTAGDATVYVMAGALVLIVVGAAAAMAARPVLRIRPAEVLRSE